MTGKIKKIKINGKTVEISPEAYKKLNKHFDDIKNNIKEDNYGKYQSLLHSK